MELSGIISEGTVKFEEPCSVPEGTRVRVLVDEPDDKQMQNPLTGLGKRLLKHAGTVPDLPEDLAAQHDHYIHGTPKR